MNRYVINMEYKPVCPFPLDPSINRVQILAANEKAAHTLALERVSRTLALRNVTGVLFKGSRPQPLSVDF